jgi:hypothetical protein
MPADRRQRMGWPAWLDRGGGDASRRRLNNQELAHCGAYDAADRDEPAFLFGVLWRAGGSGHRSGSERQAMRQEGRDVTAAHRKHIISGGRSFKLPFGTIYSTNITPDRETWIGQWSDAEFMRALHRGIGRNGEDLCAASSSTTPRNTPVGST